MRPLINCTHFVDKLLKVADEERRKSVAVVRRHQNELRESATGCVVVKSAQGWL